MAHVAARQTGSGIKAVRLSREMKPLRGPYQQPSHERLADWTVSFDPVLVERIATEIAAPLGFARVDLLFTPDGACFLNEVTLTPGNAGNYHASGARFGARANVERAGLGSIGKEAQRHG